MTWLLGSSTWANITNNICQLACAEITDSLGHAPTSSEQWVRDISTSYNVLRMPASQDVDIAAVHQPAMRTGYWTLDTSSQSGLAAPNTPPPGSIANATSVAQTTPFTSALSTTHGRWYCYLWVTTANTAAGTYSTARVTIVWGDADAGTQFTSTGVAPTAGGVITLPFGAGATVTLSDPSGIAPVGVLFFRGFSTTYMYGIDWWPMYSRRSAAWTFATAPPGVAGTDYDIIDQATPFNPANGQPTGSLFSGLGIKSATGLGGNARYVFSSCPCTSLKVYLRNNATSAGYIDLLGGGITLDAVNTNVVQQNSGWALATWLKLVQTPGSVVSTMQVQYWMSVTATGITIVLNSDPAYTGGLTCGYMGLFSAGTAYDSNDKFHALVSAAASGFGTVCPSAAQMDLSYFRQYRCQDGSHGTRDWQTYWMRNDFGAFGGGTLYTAYLLDNSQTFALGGSTYNQSGLLSLDYDSGHPFTTLKPGFDGNWWLYGYNLFEANPGNVATTVTYTNEQQNFPRGAMTDRWFHVPALGWANGDELTDTTTSAKYLLVIPDTPGLPGKYYNGTAYAGGTAIAEL
jgi:hypothetical protein